MDYYEMLMMKKMGGGGSESISDLTDVDITNPTDGQILEFNGDSNKWENKNGMVVDSAMSDSSTNPLQNKVITAELQGSKTASGNPITITDAAPVNAVDVSVDVEPIQDLHGYSYPWVGGAGKNKCEPKYYVSNDYDGTTYTDVAGDGTLTELITLGAGTYTFSIKLLSLPNTNRSISFNTAQYSGALWGVGALNTKTVGTVYSGTVTLESETTFRAYLYGSGGGTFKIQMQIESGDEYTSFAPYSNICPISGRTEENVERCGKNLFDGTSVLDCYLDDSGTIEESNRNAVIYTRCRPNTTYTVSKNAGNRFRVAYTTESVVEIGTPFSGKINNDTGTSITITTGANAKYIVAWVWNAESSTKTAMINSVQVEENNQPTTYEPYQGKTYTIDFGQTVYKARVYPTKGYAELIGAVVEADGSSDENWSITNNRFLLDDFIASDKPCANDTTLNNIFSCNSYVGKDLNWIYANRNDDNAVAIGASNRSIYVLDNITQKIGSKDLSAWKTYLSNNPLQVCYELATPITIQLTPQQIKLLENTNTLYADSGDIDVTYQPNNAIGKALAPIESNLESEINQAVEELEPTGTVVEGSDKAVTGDAVVEYVGDIIEVSTEVVIADHLIFQKQLNMITVSADAADIAQCTVPSYDYAPYADSVYASAIIFDDSTNKYYSGHAIISSSSIEFEYIDNGVVTSVSSGEASFTCTYMH